MSLSIYVEPVAGGFRATALAVPEISAEGATKQAAIAGVSSKLETRFAGGEIVEVPVPSSRRGRAAVEAAVPPGSERIVHGVENDFTRAWDRLAHDTEWDEFLAEVARIRAEVDARDAAEFAGESP